MEARLAALAVAALERPARLVPVVALGRPDLRHEVHAVDAGPAPRFGAQGVEVEDAVRRVGDDGVRHAGFADHRGQRAGVDSRQTDDAARLQPGVEPAMSAEVGRFAEIGPEDRADRGRRGRRVDHLDVLAIHADDPYMGEREGDDLGRVGRIRQDFLVAGHRRVEADLADRRAGRPDAEALDHVAAREHQNAGRHPRLPTAAGPSSGSTGMGRDVALAMRLCLSAPYRRVKQGADNVSRRSWLTLSRCATS